MHSLHSLSLAEAVKSLLHFGPGDFFGVAFLFLGVPDLLPALSTSFSISFSDPVAMTSGGVVTFGVDWRLASTSFVITLAARINPIRRTTTDRAVVVVSKLLVWIPTFPPELGREGTRPRTRLSIAGEITASPWEEVEVPAILGAIRIE